MIEELKNIRPFISFGSGVTQREVQAGETVTVWLGTLYNQNIYSFTLVAGGTVHKVSNYEYRVTYTTPGTHTIYLVVNTKVKGSDLQSNTITLNVI